MGSKVTIAHFGTVALLTRHDECGAHKFSVSSSVVVIVGSIGVVGTDVRRANETRRRLAGRTTTEHGRDEGDDRGFRCARAGHVTWRAWRARARVAPSFVVVVVGRSVSSERTCGSRVRRDGDGRGGGQRQSTVATKVTIKDFSAFALAT